MPNYSYSHLRYRINVENNDFSTYEPYLKGLRLTDYIERPDSEKMFSNEIGLYHELTHYYQDIFFPACVSERDLKFLILSNINTSSGNMEESEDAVKLRELYEYLFRTPFCHEELYSLSKNDDGIDFWSISYTDLLESYADIRSIKTILDAYYKRSKYVDNYISNYIKKHQIFCYEIDGKKLITKLRGFSRRYSICKHVFLTLFSITNSKFFYNDRMNTFNRVKIDMAEALNYEKDERFYNIERNLDIFILFCIEFALSIPSISQILRSIKGGKDRRMFHPGFRFYAILTKILQYPDTFNQLDFNSSYTEVFNQISEACGLYKYEDMANSLITNDIPFHVIRYSHNRYLKQTPNVKIGNRCNIDLFSFFKQNGSPILLWGSDSQQIYIGNGKDSFDSYSYTGSDIEYCYDYLCSDYDRIFIGSIENMEDLKCKTNLFFLQESAYSYILNLCANSILFNNNKSVCPLNCGSNENKCLLKNKLVENNNHLCIIPELIKSLAL